MRYFRRLFVTIFIIIMFINARNPIFGYNNSIDIQLSSYFDEFNVIETTVPNKQYGLRLSFANDLAEIEGYEFVYWILNDVVQSNISLEHEFIVINNMNLVGIFKETGSYAVLFMDSNGRLLDVQYTLPGQSVSDSHLLGSLPTKPGYIVSSTNRWSSPLTNIQKDTILTLQYEKVNVNTYSIAVENGSGDGLYEYNTYATVEANSAPIGYTFSHWQVEDAIVSYQAIHTFTVLGDLEIKAVYLEKDHVDAPWVGLSKSYQIRDEYTSYVGQFHLPIEYELIEFGMLSSTSSQDLLTLETEGVTIRQGSIYNGDTFEWLRSFISHENLNVRAYLVYENEYGHIITVYSNHIKPSLDGYGSELFFSEYGEGSSNNKWIEIYNPTNQAIDLGDYSIKLYNNGNTSPNSTKTFSPGTMLAPNTTYVIYNASAIQAIKDLGNESHGICSFNGDDALGLYKDDVLIDIIGEIGVQTMWNATGSGTSGNTENNTLVRMANINSPNTVWTPSEWIAYPSDTIDYIGTHSMDVPSSKSMIAISTQWDNMDYLIGDYIDLNGATIDVFYDDQTKNTIDLTEDFISHFSTTTHGYHFAYVDYYGFRDIIYYNVDKLTPTYTIPILDDIVFVDGMTLEDVSLPSGFSWADASISLSIGSHQYQVTYTPLDVEQYHIVEGIEVSFNVVETATPLIIYEVYGGGGNSGATYTHDYIVIYNTTSQNIDLTGYSVQYASAAGTTYNVVPLSGIIYHKSFYMIQLASGGSVGSPLPVSSSLTNTLNIAQTSGKVALVSSTTAIADMNEAIVIDFLGYGASATEFEGSKTATLSSTLSAKRTSFIDTNDNGADFAVGTPNLTYLELNLAVVDVVPLYMKVYYEVGNSLDLTNAVLMLVFNSGATETIVLEASMVSGFDSSAIGTYQLTIVYGVFIMTYEYYVIDYSDLDQIVIHYIDIGELGGRPGEAALIQVADIEVLIDSGDSDSSTRTALMNYLASVVTDGVIEYIIATHPDADHIGNFIDVFNTYDVETVIQYSTTGTGSTLRSNYEAAAIASGAEIIDAYTLATSSNPYISLSQGIGMQFYNTNYLVSSNNNASSIVFVLEALTTRILFNGDAEGAQESVYAPLVGDVDIFKLGHHGALAGTTSYLLETITPEIAIVTNGDYLGNQFSHPTYGAIARIYEYSPLMQVYAVTGGNGLESNRMYQRNGHIWVEIDPNGYQLSSKFYGDNPIELSATDYWQDANNPYRSLGYYYAGATGIQSGFEMALYQIIKNHSALSYDALWDKLRITDQDPNNPNNVLLLYTGRSESKYNNGGNNDEWNREHVWPNSHGINNVSPAYTDLHHIRATDVYVNNVRGDLDFSNVPHTIDNKVINAIFGDSTYGVSSSFSYKTSQYFEPRDEVKGDIARMVFYMATRYQGLNGEPNLQLINGMTSSSTPFLGDLETLLAWHEADPVDNYERLRNSLIYDIQGNRNPFIDNEAFVYRVFGN